jgi:hypothetical protein
MWLLNRPSRSKDHPTYAGNTRFSRAHKIAQWEHPHICGEHTARVLASAVFQGSPPRMRGTQIIEQFGMLDKGITPAYAGSTHSSGSTRRLARDHPHVCGEHEQYLIACSTVPGSPPRMRGTRHLSPADVCRKGVNPEYARNTSPIVAKSGEFSGSPPRMRGSTTMLTVPPSRWWEHPRIRGEHTRCPRMMAAIKGSPPHTRGAPISQHHSGIGAGATPAYVGSTLGSVELSSL